MNRRRFLGSLGALLPLSFLKKIPKGEKVYPFPVADSVHVPVTKEMCDAVIEPSMNWHNLKPGEFIYYKRGIEVPNLKMKLAPGPGFFVRKK